MTQRLIITSPDNYRPEREYILSTILSHFLGVSYCLQFNSFADDLTISLNNRELRLADDLFKTSEDQWLTSESLPPTTFSHFDTKLVPGSCRSVSRYIPVIYGKPLLSASPSKLSIEIDIFGSCFFMLTRFEEYVIAKRDSHDRFPASESLAFKQGFLNRPIVNEYTEILWGCISYLWPELTRKKHSFQVIPTHDVDRPFKYLNKTYWSIMKSMVEESLYRGSPAKSLKILRDSLLSKVTKGDIDPFNTFNYIMEQSEKRGLQSEFYFLTKVTDPQKDADYTLKDEPIKKIMQNMKQRNHIFGLHPSYNSYNDKKQIENESLFLKKSCEILGITQSKWGGRQHYLRFKIPETWNHWDSSMMDYDSSLYFAEAPGFRAGCCYEYPVFDIIQRRAMSLIERPLILMDSSFIDSDHTSISTKKLIKLVSELKSNCKIFEGNFICLWHNSNLVSPYHRALYEQTLDN